MSEPSAVVIYDSVRGMVTFPSIRARLSTVAVLEQQGFRATADALRGLPGTGPYALGTITSETVRHAASVAGLTTRERRPKRRATGHPTPQPAPQPAPAPAVPIGVVIEPCHCHYVYGCRTVTFAYGARDKVAAAILAAGDEAFCRWLRNTSENRLYIPIALLRTLREATVAAGYAISRRNC